MMPDAPDTLTPEIVSSRETLAVEMMLNSADVTGIITSPELTDDQVFAMLVAYAFSVIIAGPDGPRELLLNPTMNPIVHEAISLYPAHATRAAHAAANQAIHLLAQLPDSGSSGVR